MTKEASLLNASIITLSVTPEWFYCPLSVTPEWFYEGSKLYNSRKNKKHKKIKDY